MEKKDLMEKYDDTIWECLAFLENYLEKQRTSPNLKWYKKYFLKYDYTLEAYINDLRKAALFGMKQGLSRLVTRGMIDKTKEAQYVFWWMKHRMRQQVEYKWFGPLFLQQRLYDELHKTKADNHCSYFFELVPRIFKILREVKQGCHGAHVMGEFPILFFGNLLQYLGSDIRILTLGRTPSCDELSGNAKRFRESEPEYDYAQFFRPVRRPWEVNSYLSVCSHYFDRNPNWEYFKAFTPLLEELHGSYFCELNRFDLKKNMINLKENGWMDYLKKIQHASLEERRNNMIDGLYLPYNIAVHFNYNTPLILDTPWEHLNEEAKATFNLEEEFPMILEVLDPDIIICDFDVSTTNLIKNAQKTTIPQDFELPEQYSKMPAYLFGHDKYILVIDRKQ